MPPPPRQKVRRVPYREFAVVAVIILAATLWALFGRADSPLERDSRRLTDLASLNIALQSYVAVHGGVPAIPFGAVAETSMGRAQAEATCAGADGSGGWGDDAALSALVAEGYLPFVPEDPLNTRTHCYRYAPNPDRRGGCVWTTLEVTGASVGVVFGEPDVTIPGEPKPSGFVCNSLDTVLIADPSLAVPRICGNAWCEQNETPSNCPSDCFVGR